MRSLLSVFTTHFPYLVLGVATAYLFATIVEARDTIQMLSLTTAYVSFLFFAAALIVAPVRMMLGQSIGVSNGLRRNFGIWAGVFAIAHVVAGLGVHFDGKIWLYFVYPPEANKLIPFRYGPFGLTNYLGAVAAITFVVLLVISNNYSIRRLGPARWKRIQRLAYPLFAATVLHGLVYQKLEDRAVGLMGLLVAVSLIVIGFQVCGMSMRRSVRQER